ncbi:MAG TPA: DUF6703 family protein [Jiangellaceae bacterium]|nr:DUF6703 family protein [Jiangellaceae bacterium]
MSGNRRRARRAPNRRPAAPVARSRAPRPSVGRRPAAAPPTAPQGFRGGLERASMPVLTRLSRAPRWLVGLAPAALLLGGLLAPAPWGPALLALVVLFLAWLLTLSWPKLEPRARVVRVGVTVLLLAVVVAQAAGLF